MKNAALTAEKLLGKNNIKSIQYVSPLFSKKYKVIVFVPAKDIDSIILKMGLAGAGRIGNYTLCSFRSAGTGTFKAMEGSNPKVGKKGTLVKTEEERLEMICEQKDLEKVIDTIYKHHPYEEPACEVYQVIVKDTKTKTFRVLAELKKPVKVKDIFLKINSAINLQMLKGRQLEQKVQKVFIDESGRRDFEISPSKIKTLVLRRNNSEFNTEVI